MSELQNLRLRVQEKLDNVGTGDDVVFQPAEIDRHINQAIRFVSLHAPFDIVRPLATVETVVAVGGSVTIPGEYFRFWYARSRNRKVTFIDPEEIDDKLSVTGKLPNAKNQYLYEHDATTQRILPVEATPIEYHFFKEPTNLTGDTDLTELTLVGEDMAVEYAFGLSLTSKGFATEVAGQVMDTVFKQLGLSGNAQS